MWELKESWLELVLRSSLFSGMVLVLVLVLLRLRNRGGGQILPIYGRISVDEPSRGRLCSSAAVARGLRFVAPVLVRVVRNTRETCRRG